jgi:hypothetical protein
VNFGPKGQPPARGELQAGFSGGTRAGGESAITPSPSRAIAPEMVPWFSERS